MHSKPISKDGQLYVFEPSTFYASINPRHAFFTAKSRKSNCQWAQFLKRELCREPRIMQICEQHLFNYLDHDIIASNACFTKLANNNYMTHVSNTIHFTIVKPTAINITCSNESRSVFLNTSSKIVDASNCLITGNEFRYRVNGTVNYRLLYMGDTKMRIISVFLLIISVIFAGTGVLAIILCLLFNLLISIPTTMDDRIIDDARRILETRHNETRRFSTTPNEMLNYRETYIE